MGLLSKLGRLSAAIIVASSVFGAVAAHAQSTASVSGGVANVNTGAPIAGARVELDGGAAPKVATTAKDGTFSFAGIVAGTYSLKATANLYQPYITPPFPVAEGQNFQISLFVDPVSTTNITTLGHITVSGRPTLNTSSSTNVSYTSSDFVKAGDVQIEQLLETTPGITLEHYDNGAPGAVATITIRGAGGFGGGTDGGSNTGYEVLLLQDGEPVRNGQYGDFDASSLTPDIYSRVEVIKGIGGTSLFGANTIGGTVNLVTRDPSKTEGAEATIGYGGFQTSNFNLLQTDSIGKFGYVLDLHRYNSYGFYPPGFTVIFAPFGGPGDVAQPDQRFTLKSGMAKVKYDFSGSTSATVTALDESDWRSQDGLISNPEGFTSNGLPVFFGFPGDYVWNIQPKYSLDLRTSVGGGTLVLRGYSQWLERVVDGLGEPADICCFLSRSVDHLTGQLAQWTKTFGNQTLTFSVGGNGDTFFYGTSFNAAETFGELLNNSTFGKQIYRTYLVRDDDQLSSKFDLVAAGYYSDYDTVDVKRFDPRVAVVNKPDSNTVIKASIGTGFAAPRLSDLFLPLDNNVNDAFPSAACPTANPCFGSSGNPRLKAETGTGAEVSYQRLFGQRGTVTVDVYRTTLSNHILDGLFPQPPGTTFSDGTTPMLFVQEPINIAGGVYTGIELSGTLPVSDMVGLNAYYNTQAAYPTGVDVPTEIVLQDVVNNQQYLGVPLHQIGWSLNYQNPIGGAGYIGADWYGPNNAFNLPSFWTYKAGATISWAYNNSINLSWKNIFNTNGGLFQAFRAGVPYSGFSGPYPTNGYNVAPHTLQATYTYKFGSLAR